jgi:hypothetical protein
LLDGVQFFIIEFYYLPASHASKMTVVTMAVNGLIMHMAVFVPRLPDEGTVHNEWEVAVDRGLGHTSPPVPQAQIKFIYVKMVSARKDLSNDLLSFRRIPKPLPGGIGPEKVYFGTHCPPLL